VASPELHLLVTCPDDGIHPSITYVWINRGKPGVKVVRSDREMQEVVTTYRRMALLGGQTSP
jgi:hypothetical protein